MCSLGLATHMEQKTLGFLDTRYKHILLDNLFSQALLDLYLRGHDPTMSWMTNILIQERKPLTGFLAVMLK